MSRLGSIALVFAAAIADHGGSHTLAFDLLLVAIPVAAYAGLETISDRLDGKAQQAQTYVWGLVVALLLLATASRAPALGDGGVPPLARSALLACLAVFCLQALAAIAAELRSG